MNQSKLMVWKCSYPTKINHLKILILAVSCIFILCFVTTDSTRTYFLVDVGNNYVSQVDQEQSNHNHYKLHGRHLLMNNIDNDNDNIDKKQQQQQLRILYTITSLNEYDEGGRSTESGYDRLQYTIIPVIQEGVYSMLSYGYNVDIMFICHYTLQDHRYQLIRNALPNSVNIQYWDNASPISYRVGSDSKKMVTNTIGLSRQHRFVIKDNIFKYDFFINFEDDMIIKGQHIQTYIYMTQQLYKLRQVAPNTLTKEQIKKYSKNSNSNFYGIMTKDMLQRTFPGLMRVEVLLNENSYGTQRQLDPIPVTKTTTTTIQSENEQQQQQQPLVVDPEPCCHLSYSTNSTTGTSKIKNSALGDIHSKPNNPSADKMFIWETGIRALGVREMPSLSSSYSGGSTNNNNNDDDDDLGWVTMLRGSNMKDMNKQYYDYWSGRDGYYNNMTDNKRPVPSNFAYMNNQGGWMATRQQIWEWHTIICPGGFLPPYDKPHYNVDGLDLRNVEWWSGGLSLFRVQHSCNMQRIISLNPKHFSNQLIYHSANNKQRQLKHKRNMFVKVNNLLGQLHTVRLNAQKVKEQQEKQK